MGSPKQLLHWKGELLIQRAARTVLDSGCSPVVVVLGAYANLIAPTLRDFPVHLIENEEWVKGMGLSIRAGLKESLRLDSDLDGVLITLCDQPHVTAANLRAMISFWGESGKAIVASRYNHLAGVPAAFARSIFSELINLEGESGARKLINIHRNACAEYDLPAAAFDLDTPADLLSAP